MRSLKVATRYLYAPMMLLGMNGAGYYIVATGLSYAWLLLVLVAAIGTAFAAERVLPTHDEWNHSHGDDTANFWHAAVYETSAMSGVVLLPLIAWLVPWDGIWPHGWPLVIQVLLAIVVADFAFTMVHYWSHKLPLLWRLHAVHHGVPRMYGFNGLVRHPLHQSIDMFIGTLPLALAGMPADVALLLGLAISVQLLVQHSNVDYELGPFRNAMSIGRLHHLHHVNWGKEGDCNFGLFTTVWDHMLGTFQAEPSREIKATDLGVDDVPEFPKSYWQQLMFPFVYEPGKGVKSAQAKLPPSSAPSNNHLHPAE